MDNFILQNKWADLILYFILLNGCLAILEVHFFGRLVNKALKWFHYLAYLLLIYAICAAEIRMRTSFTLATLFESAALFGFGWLVIRTNPTLSAIATILTITIMQVVNGIFQSLSSIICSLIFPYTQFVPLILLMSNLLSIAAIYLTYRYVEKTFNLENSPMNQYVLFLLLPILFVLIVIQHVFSVYGQTVVLNSNGSRAFPNVNDWEMLLIQFVAFFCLMAVLFSYRKLSLSYELKMQNALLEQQADLQNTYMQEIKTRYEQTRAFRHDLKSHLTVLNGLLKQGQPEKASEYLDKLEFTSNTLSFPCQTGNAVIDMLLSNKLGLAQQEGIKIDCNVKIPQESTIDEMDLCIVFSNAVDNAIKACTQMTEKDKYITLSAFQKGKFLMLEIENSRRDTSIENKGSGVGLCNIKNAAAKYHGVVEIESRPECFKLNVLFVIPQH